MKLVQLETQLVYLALHYTIQIQLAMYSVLLLE